MDYEKFYATVGKMKKVFGAFGDRCEAERLAADYAIFEAVESGDISDRSIDRYFYALFEEGVRFNVRTARDIAGRERYSLIDVDIVLPHHWLSGKSDTSVGDRWLEIEDRIKEDYCFNCLTVRTHSGEEDIYRITSASNNDKLIEGDSLEESLAFLVTLSLVSPPTEKAEDDDGEYGDS